DGRLAILLVERRGAEIPQRPRRRHRVADNVSVFVGEAGYGHQSRRGGDLAEDPQAEKKLAIGQLQAVVVSPADAEIELGVGALHALGAEPLDQAIAFGPGFPDEVTRG